MTERWKAFSNAILCTLEAIPTEGGCNISSRLSVRCGEIATCLLRLQDVRSPATPVACHIGYSATSLLFSPKLGQQWFLETSNYAPPTKHCGALVSFASCSNLCWGTILVLRSGFNRKQWTAIKSMRPLERWKSAWNVKVCPVDC